MNTTEINKCIKIVLSQNVLIIPFNGNLTKRVKKSIAETAQKFINKKNKSEIPLEDFEKVVESPMYSSLEKNIIIDYHDNERVSLRGVGWSSCNLPSSQLCLIY